MNELEMLEMELQLLQDNIERLKKFKEKCNKNGCTYYNSRVVGEFKHRLITLKQRITLASSVTTLSYLSSK